MSTEVVGFVKDILDGLAIFLSSPEYQSMRTALIQFGGFLTGVITIILGVQRVISILRHENDDFLTGSTLPRRVRTYVGMLELERGRNRDSLATLANKIEAYRNVQFDLIELVAIERARADAALKELAALKAASP